MFPIYPGFENLPLHVDVEWQGRTRPVVARLEQWPGSEEALVVCSFEDDKRLGEWVLENNNGLYCRRNPRRLLRRHVTHDGPRPHCTWRLSGRATRQLKSLIACAFHRYNMGVKPLRIVHLPELPHAPHVAIERHPYFFWCPSTNRNSFLQFRLGTRPTGFSPPYREAKSQLLDGWKDKSSDARFAWGWASLTKSEKRRLLTGYDGDSNEMACVMRWILNSSTLFWQHAPRWRWAIRVIPIQDLLRGHCPSLQLETELAQLEIWNAILRAHFIPRGRADLLRDHPCIEDEMRTLSHVFVGQAPTAHEQLEAKLQLREWLRDKATPQQIKDLLDT